MKSSSVIERGKAMAKTKKVEGDFTKQLCVAVENNDCSRITRSLLERAIDEIVDDPSNSLDDYVETIMGCIRLVSQKESEIINEFEAREKLLNEQRSNAESTFERKTLEITRLNGVIEAMKKEHEDEVSALKAQLLLADPVKPGSRVVYHKNRGKRNEETYYAIVMSIGTDGKAMIMVVDDGLSQTSTSLFNLEKTDPIEEKEMFIRSLFLTIDNAEGVSKNG